MLNEFCYLSKWWIMRSILIIHALLSFMVLHQFSPSLHPLFLLSLQAVTSPDRRRWCSMSYFWTFTTPEMGLRWPIRKCLRPAQGRPCLGTLSAITTMAASLMARFSIPGVCLSLLPHSYRIVLMHLKTVLLWERYSFSNSNLIQKVAFLCVHMYIYTCDL